MKLRFSVGKPGKLPELDIQNSFALRIILARECHQELSQEIILRAKHDPRDDFPLRAIVLVLKITKIKEGKTAAKKLEFHWCGVALDQKDFDSEYLPVKIAHIVSPRLIQVESGEQRDDKPKNEF